MKAILLTIACFLALWLPAQTLDSIALRQVDSLIQEVRTLLRNRDIPGAILILEQAERIATEQAGRESVSYASCIFEYGNIALTKGDRLAAEQRFLEAKDIHVRVSGGTHAKYAEVLYGLGALVYYRVDDAQCEAYLLQAKDVQERTLGRKHIHYGRILNALGNYYRYKGIFDKCEAFMLEALAVTEETLGKDHPNYPLMSENLGKFYLDQGRFAEAEEKMLASRDIKARILGADHPDYAVSMAALAYLYHLTAEYERAEAHYEQALSIMENAFGRESLQYAQYIDGIAVLYIAIDEWDKAERYLLEGKRAFEALGQKNGPAYRHLIRNLAGLYLEMGEYPKSEALFQEARAFLASNSSQSKDYALLRANMALLHLRQGRYAEAEQATQEALAIMAALTGAENQVYAQILNTLGLVRQAQGQYAEAETVLSQAVEIRARLFGKNDLSYSESLGALAEVYRHLKQYERAEALYLEVQQLQENVLGRRHSDYFATQRSLAMLYADWGQHTKAAGHWLAYCHLARELAEKAAAFMPEAQMLAYLRTLEAGIGDFYAFAQQQGEPALAGVAYDNALFFGGMLLEHRRRLSAAVSRADEPAQQAYAQWQRRRRLLAVQYARPVAERKKVAELEEEAQALEKELTRRLAAFSPAPPAPQWQSVQAALRPGEAALAFVRYAARASEDAAYAALVLRNGRETPQLVMLFEEKQLATLLHAEGKTQTAALNDLYAPDQQGAELYRLIWAPLAPALPEGTTLHFAAAGMLHRLNLGAIPAPHGRVMADVYLLSSLGNTRQLLLQRPPAPTPTQAAELYGGIQYDLDPESLATAPVPSEGLAMQQRGLDFSQTDTTLRGDTWRYLRWTEVEVAAAAETMQKAGLAPRVSKGTAATEEAFKNIGASGPSPHILHIATHGFFFPDPIAHTADVPGQAIKRSEHPMIRSGLLLAGANHAWKTGRPLRPDMEDGILTAYEITQMNLSNTELVVLSACETGLGDLVGSEGVYGLQRAFKIAGARYLIMSLWQVPDFQTQVFMSAFYKRWLEDKMPLPEAFRATQSALRAKYGEAFKWAGFVLVE